MPSDSTQMNQDGQLDRMLNALPYPLEKDEILAHAQQAGASSQLMASIKQALPEGEYASAEEIKRYLQPVAQPARNSQQQDGQARR